MSSEIKVKSTFKKKKNISIFKFLSQVRQEFLKIKWPPRKSSVTLTGMVFVMVFVMVIFFLIIDTVMSFLVSWLLKI